MESRTKMKIENEKSQHAPILTVIICLYNTDPLYVEACLKSIYCERMSNCEIILVDDGSTIDYSNLLSRYSPICIRTGNRGLLSARITGIAASHGDYIAFVDADDAVTSRYHTPMLRAAIKNGADMVIGEWGYLTERGIRVHESKLHTLTEDPRKQATSRGKMQKRNVACHRAGCPSSEEPINCDVPIYDSALRLLTDAKGKDHTYYVMWNKVFKRGLLEKTAEKLKKLGLDNKGISYGEDVLFNYFNYKFSGTVIPFSSGLYLYRIHPMQSVAASTGDALKNQIQSMGYIFDILMKETSSYEARIGLDAWRQMIARSHFSIARRRGYDELFPLIRRAYGINRLQASRPADKADYLKREAAGENFSDIEAAIRKICDTGSGVTVFYEKKCRYVRRIIFSLATLSERVTDKGCKIITVPKRRISVTSRLVTSRLLSGICSRLLPPGSKLRELIKRNLML